MKRVEKVSKMIDFHTHILPEIDDGSRNIEMSCSMLEQEYQQGVREIIATPHFYAENDSVEHFLEKRKDSYQRLMESVDTKPSTPAVKLGAEVYYFSGIGKADMISRLCIEGTNILLLELPFAQWTKEMRKDVKALVFERKFTVILAHVERYYALQKDFQYWDDIMEYPLYPQINTGSLLRWKTRRFGLNFVKSGMKVLLGTDCHNLEGRAPNMQKGRDVLEGKLGTEVLDEIDRRGMELLK